MNDITNNLPSIDVRNRPATAVRLLPLLIFFGAMMISADFTAVDLSPLRALRISYLKAMDYAHFIIPGVCALLWLAMKWKWPYAGSIIPILLCFLLVGLIPVYAEAHITRIPVIRWLTTDAAESFELRNGFPIAQVGTKDGHFVIVAPQNAKKASEELSRLGVFRPNS